MSAHWTTRDLPDQSGRSIIVTGANSGVGFEAAKALAAAGAQVTLAVRDTAKGDAAAAKIGGGVTVRRLDLADLASVRAFAEETTDAVDVLVNNAGVMAIPLSRTVDGFEMQLGTNFLGPFALTNLLLPVITDRVVNLSSTAHKMGKIGLDDLNFERRTYRPWNAYGQSKLADLMITTQLQHRLQQAGSSVRAVAAHPGFSSTNLQGRSGNAVADQAIMAITRVVGMPAWQGALPTLYAATVDVPGDSFVGPDGPGEARGYPTLVGRTATARDVETGRRLWERAEELTGTQFLL